MKVDNNKVVAISYILEVEGAVIDKATSEKPLEYIHGAHMLIPRFEVELFSKTEGDSFDFTLSPEEGYGEYNPKHCFDIPKSSFEVDGKLREDLLTVGRIIPMLNSSGEVVQGKVAAIGEDTVTMDFNHPMAGKSLHFTGKVESIREATEKELTEGLHGEFLPPEEKGCCHHGGGCCHGKGHHKDGEGCCHGEGHGEGGCCHHNDN